MPIGLDITISDFLVGMAEQVQHIPATSGCHFEFNAIDAQSIPYNTNGLDIAIENDMLYSLLACYQSLLLRENGTQTEFYYAKDHTFHALFLYALIDYGQSSLLQSFF